MKYVALSFRIAFCLVPAVVASAQSAPVVPFAPAPVSSFAMRLVSSSSSSQPEGEPAAIASDALPDAPSSSLSGSQSYARRYPKSPLAVASHTRPFSTVAIAATFGLGGVGVDVATPLNTRINLRAGASFLSVTTSFTVDTIPISGTAHLNDSHVGIDWFLFNNSFHISPGITLYGNTNYDARIFVPGNQVITVDDTDYTSDPNDPIHGTAYINFATHVAPRLTVGWGNMIPHKDKNWSFPFEFGLDYRKAPTVAITLAGSSCDAPGDCGPISTDPDTQANIVEEEQEITSDLHPLRFFPILSFGVSYKFGH